MSEIADRIRASYTPERAWAEMSGDLPAFLIYRRISFWLTAPLLRAGVSATAVTSISALAVFALPFGASFGGERDFVLVSALALLVSVLDCVDGNLARTQPSRGKVGALFDAAVDAAFWCLLLVSFGVLAQKRGAAYGVALGAGAALATLYGRRVRDEFRSLYAARAEMPATRPARIGLGLGLVIALAGLEHVYALAILAGGVLSRLDAALVAVAIYAAGVSLASTVLAFASAARIDDSANEKS